MARPRHPARGNRKTFAFSLILAGMSDTTEELEDALFDAGCDDALLGSRDGVLFLDFEREARSLEEAILSAVAGVYSADAGVSVARVEPDDLVTASEMARRLRRSRESVRLLVLGERGPGTFPPPVANLTERSPIWRWTDVARWFADNYGKSEAEGVLEHAETIAAVNAALDLHRHLRSPTLVNRLWRAIRVSKAAGKPYVTLKVVPAKRKPRGRDPASRFSS